MKTLHRTTFIALLIIALSTPLKSLAQYHTGIGLRGGYFSGLTFKHFFDTDNAHGLELILSAPGTFGYRGMAITGLYEFQRPFNDSKMQTASLDWFVGIGGHIAFYNGSYYYYVKKDGTKGYYTGQVTTIGIDLIAGIEYLLPIAPFTIGVDIKPFFDFTYRGPGYIDAALSVRYVFGN